MSPEYTVICIPLDSAGAQKRPTSFPIKIICQLAFPQGDYTPAVVRDVLAEHPILKSPRQVALKGYTKPLDAWKLDRRFDTEDSIPLTLIYRGKTDFGEMARTLDNYLGVKTLVRSIGVQHDSRFDFLDAEHFVDIAHARDEVVALGRVLQRLGISSLNGSPLVGTSLADVSIPAAHHLDASVHTALLQGLSVANPDGISFALESLGFSALRVSAVRNMLEKIRRRLSVEQTPNTRPASVSAIGVHAPAGIQDVAIEDPNVAIHAALKNNLLAGACGFVTEWVAQADRPINGDFVLQLDMASFLTDAIHASVTVMQTAFRRAQHTHPLSFVDMDKPTTGNAGLAALNSKGGPRYRASAINTESNLVKELIVQSANSLAALGDVSQQFGNFNETLDTRPPQLLHDRQFGTAEPETSGITFSAPIEDLVTPLELQAQTPQDRQNKYPCLFLEDLWIGYRLDISKGESGIYNSAHAQQQRIKFASSVEIVGTTEDYFEREQADDPERGFSSTEFATYNGMTTAQARDYRVVMGVEAPADAQTQGPFTVDVTGYGKATRLVFGNIYRYRLRNVFLGGVSLGSDDPDLSGLSPDYHQDLPFFRARAYKPGELITVSRDAHNREKSDGNTIYLSEENPVSKLTLVPTPIDVETSRYHGLFLANKGEPDRYRNRKYVGDVGKFFVDGVKIREYFFDPDISGVIIRAKMLNGNANQADKNIVFHYGAYCEVKRHLDLPPVKQKYGEDGEWEGFSPITLTFKTTTSLYPSIERVGFIFDCHHIEVHIPPAADMELSIIPDLTAVQLVETASFVSSSSQLRESKKLSSPSTALHDWLPVPAMAEQIVRVIHAVRRPLAEPRLISSSVYHGPKCSFARAVRELDSETAEISGRIEVDAASTGQVKLLVSWSDINDVPEMENYVLNAGSTTTATHSIVFKPHEPKFESALARFSQLAAGEVLVDRVGDASYTLTDQFKLQCAENKVFLGLSGPAGVGVPVDRWHAINFNDHRRKIATARAVTQSRFANMFGESSIEAVSPSLEVDVQSTLRMSSPVVSHILPVRRATRNKQGGAQQEQTEYAIRIYVNRPWFESGPGERLAIGCLVGDEPEVIRQSLDKRTTQWGEDPMERPRLVSTTRMPKASDFIALSQEGTEWINNKQLYPATGPDETAAVIYRDNVLLPSESTGAPSRRLSIASFALEQDRAQGLWYCDVAIAAEFFGWCGLALYRHQPHACEGRELSGNADWAYASFIHGDPLTWVKRNGNLHVTVGPIYDPYTSFEFDAMEFRDGISENLSADRLSAIVLRRYRVGSGYYFEGVVSTKSTQWELVKKRFNYGVASIPIGYDRE